MNKFVPGQRWISSTELQMGLGTVLTTDGRRVTMLFPATGETRIYASESAPLSRVIFSPGDTILSNTQVGITIDSLREQDDLITYVGSDENGKLAEIEEGQLNHYLQLNRPADRLLSGQIDTDRWFELRYQTLQHANRLAHFDLRGLTGARTSLIPHQLYIAYELAHRYAPRVLLADEVGLGKTIEAGLILHQQIVTEQIRRVLIIVPETLMHQWLVEMLRRFNLRFSIFDAERCLAINSDSPGENPFHAEQLVLCSIDFLASDPERAEQVANGEWDLLIVDEAHHLEWSPQSTSPEYELIERLAGKTKGVLLLTATPQQLGKTGHFARLRLLDPPRFPDFESFEKEENSYRPIAEAIEQLLADQALSTETIETLNKTIPEGDNKVLLDLISQPAIDQSEYTAARDDLVEHLLDRHGTGRVLFRNTRETVKGFPERKVTPFPQPLPREYAVCIESVRSVGISNPQLLLSPELLYQAQAMESDPHWSMIDPRVNWLAERLKALKPEKALVICSSAQTALDIAEALRTRFGMHVAIFHEGLSIVERDRAAAFFAVRDFGSQALICSEIGSEGRNFQFAHHLILFDLPLNPDLLEQRIGRLDRIGQLHTIEINVPYLDYSAQAIQYAWFHDGLGAFEKTSPAAQNVFAEVESTLIEALHQVDEGIGDLKDLIGTSKSLHEKFTSILQNGRDRLLEYNSCRPNVANELCVRALDEDAASTLPEYMEDVFDCFGVETEFDSDASLILHPGDHMSVDNFPALPEDGIKITYKRQTALSNEELAFLTWDHPMVVGALDLVLSNEHGNAAVTAIKYRGMNPGTMLLECLFVLDTTSAREIASTRFLPPTTIRLVIDKSGKDFSAQLSHESIAASRESVDTDTANKVVAMQKEFIKQLINKGLEIAQGKSSEIVSVARKNAEKMLDVEIDRLRALSHSNPSVREEEIQFFVVLKQKTLAALETASLRLEAVRVVVTT